MQFRVKDSGRSFTIFTTRADTIFGVTFMVLAPESELVADARAPIGDVEEAFDVELDQEILEDSEADTIGGLAFEHLGGIPAVGDEVTVGRFLIRIVEVSGRRISKVEIVLLPPEEDDDNEDDEN